MTTTPTDRAAIEALARELDHEPSAEWARRVAPVIPWGDPDSDGTTVGDYIYGWHAIFDAWEHDDYRNVWWTSEDIRALLAFLDEVWAGLTAAQRRMLTLCVNGHPGLATTLRECWPVGASQYRCAGRLVALHLAVGSVERGFYKATPLGRAVLRRAKEQGR